MRQYERKPITASVQLLPGRDDDLLDYKETTGSNISELLREGARYLLSRQKARQTFEDQVLDALDRIEDKLAGGVTTQAQPTKKSGNPFLDDVDL
jgi:hypothetical protein